MRNFGCIEVDSEDESCVLHRGPVSVGLDAALRNEPWPQISPHSPLCAIIPWQCAIPRCLAVEPGSFIDDAT